MTHVIDRFKWFYASLRDESLAAISELYEEGVEFKDPVHQINGLEPLSAYMEGLCQNLNYCDFEYISEQILPERAYFVWVMTYSHPRIGSGKPIKVKGMTEIHFREKIHYHEDFYDLGAMFYEHLPVIGWVINKVKQRIAQN